MFVKPPHGFDETTALETIKGFSTDSITLQLVIEKDDKIVASVLVYFIKYARFGLRMLVEDFVIDSQYRRRGLGSLILNYLRELGKESKCTGMVLHTGKQNASAQNFYKKLGMEENVMFKLDL